MTVISEGISIYLLIVLIALLGIIIFLLLRLIEWLKNGGKGTSQPPRSPQTFIRGVSFNPAVNRWQLTCLDTLSQNPDYDNIRDELPPIESCSQNPGELAPPLEVQANDVVVFDFTQHTNNEFAWVELQFPEPDLFVGLGGLSNSFDDYVVRILPGQRLPLTVRERSRCHPTDNYSRFVYAVHVVQKEITADTDPSGYVQGGSPPEIKFRHA